MANKENALVLHIPQANRLPDNAQYTNRFEIPSSSSDNVYTIAQSKSGLWWSCGCRGWIRHKNCTHLKTLGLPGNYIPFTAILPAGEK
jgi:hypothetical protein